MVRGLEKHHEQDAALLIRDTRTLGQKVKDFLASPLHGAVIFVVIAATIFVFPSVADLLVFFSIFFAIYCYYLGRRSKLPFRMPLRSNVKDYNDIHPGTRKPSLARGITYFGNEIRTNDELWFSNEDMRTHVLIFGSTGSGKTESLVSLAYSALLQGSGFIYVDGKGDNSLFAKIFSLCRKVGREDDVLLINYMTAARDVIGAQESRLSNTLNPFSSGSSSMLIQLVVGLMGDTGAAGMSADGDMWKGRAINFVEGLMKLLVYMRDQGHLLLDANTIRSYFLLPKLEQIVIDRQLPRDNQEAVPLKDVPDLVMDGIVNYVYNLPGYDPKKKGKQVSQVLEQHGFITMQLTRVFGTFADAYSHVMRTNFPEVYMQDVVLNRRILVVLLPALEKSPEELANLGKVIIATMRAMMASGLGDAVEGRFQDVIQRKPTNAPTPYLCILDEYGYYAVKGFAVVPAQARSLGFSTIFAGQDLPAFQRASKEEAASIGANTNIKICMKLEDPTETWEFFSKTAGEAYVTKVDAFQTDSQSLMNNYLDTRSASAEKRARIDLLDLKDQGLGEAHIFFKSAIIRARFFYANPKIVKAMRLNHFLKVDKPVARTLIDSEKRLRAFEQMAENKELYDHQGETSEEVSLVIKSLEKNKTIANPIERAVMALLAFDKREEHVVDLTETKKVVEEEVPDISDRLNIFVRVMLPKLAHEFVPQEDIEAFGNQLLQKQFTREKVELIERLLGKPSKQASHIAWEIVRDMNVATDYPPDVPVKIPVAELVDAATKLAEYVEKLPPRK